jgi:hypothetical protein
LGKDFLLRDLYVTDEVSIGLEFVPKGLSTLLTAEVKPEVMLFFPGRGAGRRNEGKDRSVLIGKLNPDHVLPVLRGDLFRVLRSGSYGMEFLCVRKCITAPRTLGGYITFSRH